MKFWKFFSADIKSIIKNPSSLIILIALMIMPGFYAWFNIVASWNPYGNTQNITIAVVNDDKGIDFIGKEINIGETVVKNLKENHSIGWNFVNKETAEEGIIQGKYYASVVIPQDFSENLVSFLSDNPKKPELIYTVNEKLNAIAPKITQKGVESISNNIEANFISSLYEEIFKKMNKTGEKIESYQKSITRARKFLKTITEKLPEIHSLLEEGKGKIALGFDILPKIENAIPPLNKALIEIQNHSRNLLPTREIIDHSKEFLQTQVNFLKALFQDGIGVASVGNELGQVGGDVAKNILNKTEKKLLRIQKVLSILYKFTDALKKFSNTSLLDPILEKNTILQNRVARYLQINRKIYRLINSGKTLTNAVLKDLMDIANSTDQAYRNLVASIQDFLPHGFEPIAQKIDTIQSEIYDTAQKMQGYIPIIAKESKILQEKLQTGNEKVNEILSHWTEIQNVIIRMNTISNKLSDERIIELLRIMLLNPESEENFFKHPVQIVTRKLFSSPNYGSSIAPFFTVLALWVGALLCVSSLSVRTTLAQKEKSPKSGYISRLLFFWIIGIGQASIVILGNILIFKVHILHPWLALLSSIYIILLFHLCIYSLVYLLGNAGKLLAILVLLLQLSAGSGTFPVELTNNFFVDIHPYLPFTYAINLFREVSFGIVENIFWYNIGMLGMMFIIIFCIAFFLSPYLSKFAIKMDKRTEGMDIFH